MTLAGLNERQYLEAFVLSAKTTGKMSHGIRLLHEHELAREEVLQVHQLWITSDDGIGLLFKRQQDVDADAVFTISPDMACFHDAAGRAGDDHITCFGDLLAEKHCL